MGRYLIVIDEKYVRAEVADNTYIVEHLEGVNYSNSEWYFTEGELVIGIYEGGSEQIAVDNASEDYSIDKRALKVYEVI